MFEQVPGDFPKSPKAAAAAALRLENALSSVPWNVRILLEPDEPPARKKSITKCVVCYKRMEGRSDRKYCTPKCRQKAYRSIGRDRYI